MNSKKKIGAIILAAGRGKRMKSGKNKTSLLLHGKPLIAYPVEVLKALNIDPVIIVVGHAKKSVQDALKEHNVIFAEQKEQLGTGHAVKCAMDYLPQEVTDIVNLYGDDSYNYSKKLISKIINKHSSEDSVITFMTIQVDNPTGLGRIVRDSKGSVKGIVEEKDATDDERRINEINPNIFIFKSSFLKKYLSKIPKSPVTGEYYLPHLINLASENGEKISVVQGGYLNWRGVNTQDELKKAHDILEKNK